MPAPRTLVYTSFCYDDRQLVQRVVSELSLHPEVENVVLSETNGRGDEVTSRLRVTFRDESGPVMDPDLAHRVSRYEEEERPAQGPGMSMPTPAEALYMARREMAEQMLWAVIEPLSGLTAESVDQMFAGVQAQIRIRQMQRAPRVEAEMVQVAPREAMREGAPRQALDQYMRQMRGGLTAMASDLTDIYTNLHANLHPIADLALPERTVGERANQAISEMVATPEGRERLAASMVAPLRTRLDYQGVARSVLAVERMPEGALPSYVDVGGDRMGEYLGDGPDRVAHEEREAVRRRENQAADRRIRGWEAKIRTFTKGRWVHHPVKGRAEVVGEGQNPLCTIVVLADGETSVLRGGDVESWELEPILYPSAYEHLLDD